MKLFKSIADVDRVRGDPLHRTIKELVLPVIAECPDRRPEDDGYLVLLEPEDVDRVLHDLDLPWRPAEVPFESVTMIDGCYHAVYLANDQFSLGILIPDADWLPDDLRRVLEMHLVEP
jgi:hypothetical protein